MERMRYWYNGQRETTVKELLRSILQEKGGVHATEGNYNNHIGVPLTLLGLDQEHSMRWWRWV